MFTSSIWMWSRDIILALRPIVAKHPLVAQVQQLIGSLGLRRRYRGSRVARHVQQRAGHLRMAAAGCGVRQCQQMTISWSLVVLLTSPPSISNPLPSSRQADVRRSVLATSDRGRRLFLSTSGDQRPTTHLPPPSRSVSSCRASSWPTYAAGLRTRRTRWGRFSARTEST